MAAPTTAPSTRDATPLKNDARDSATCQSGNVRFIEFLEVGVEEIDTDFSIAALLSEMQPTDAAID